jgi:endonuclease III
MSCPIKTFHADELEARVEEAMQRILAERKSEDLVDKTMKKMLALMKTSEAEQAVRQAELDELLKQSDERIRFYKLQLEELERIEELD